MTFTFPGFNVGIPTSPASSSRPRLNEEMLKVWDTKTGAALPSPGHTAGVGGGCGSAGWQLYRLGLFGTRR